GRSRSEEGERLRRRGPARSGGERPALAAKAVTCVRIGSKGIARKHVEVVGGEGSTVLYRVDRTLRASGRAKLPPRLHRSRIPPLGAITCSPWSGADRFRGQLHASHAP